MSTGTRYVQPDRGTRIFNGAVASLTKLGMSVWRLKGPFRPRPDQRRVAQHAR